MIKPEDDGIWIVLNETIACHHDELFSCLTTPDGLSRWFPVTARVDLRTGGQIVLGWDKAFSRTSTITILEYKPDGHITWDWQLARRDTHCPVYWTVEASVEEAPRHPPETSHSRFRSGRREPLGTRLLQAVRLESEEPPVP